MDLRKIRVFYTTNGVELRKTRVFYTTNYVDLRKIRVFYTTNGVGLRKIRVFYTTNRVDMRISIGIELGKAFLGPGLKPLPERLIFIAREQFFGLDRISGFCNLNLSLSLSKSIPTDIHVFNAGPRNS